MKMTKSIFPSDYPLSIIGHLFCFDIIHGHVPSGLPGKDHCIITDLVSTVINESPRTATTMEGALHCDCSTKKTVQF